MQDLTLYWAALAAAFHRSRVEGPEASAAWRPFDDLIRERLLRYARLALRRPTYDDEDAVQDIVLRMRKYAGGAPLEANAFRVWMYKIARSICKNLARGPRAQEHEALENHDRPDPQPEGAPEICRNDEFDKLRAVLDGLPAEEAELIRLRHFEGRTFKTIARRRCERTYVIRRRHEAACESLRPKLIAAGFAQAS